MITGNFVGENAFDQSFVESEEIDAGEIKRSAKSCVKKDKVSLMKSKFFVLAVSLLTALGLSSCYTEFATTGDDNGYVYPNNSSAYYDSTYAGGSYDTTGAPIINNYYGYSSSGYDGYGYPWYDYDNCYTPSPWWWQSDLWLGFGSGWNSWYYGGLGWGSPYYAYGGYGLGPYYSAYGYSPFYPYGGGYYGRGYGYLNPIGRPRTSGDTREGRESYGGGSTPVPYSPSAGSVGGTRTAGANSGASANGQSGSTEGARTRGNGSAQQQPGSNTNSQPQSQPGTQDQPRVRDAGPSGGGNGNNNNSGGRPRGRSSAAYSRSISGSHRVMLYRNYRQSNRMMRLQQPQRQMQYAQSPRSSGSRSAPVTSSARSGGGRSSSGGGRGRR